MSPHVKNPSLQVDIGTLPFPGSNQQDGAAEGKSNQKFLEDMVRRLSEELSKLQSSDKPAPDSRSVASATPPAFLEVKAALSPARPRLPCSGPTPCGFAPIQGLAEGAPLPLWLSDAKYMSPLLVIYDKQLREQVCGCPLSILPFCTV